MAKTVKLRCNCGKEFRRRAERVRKDKKNYCSKSCQLAATSRPDGTHLCRKCESWFPNAQFKWYSDVRYQTGNRRSPYCNACRPKQSKAWYALHRAYAKKYHDEWRERCLAEGGDKALSWYFSRNLGNTKWRSKKFKLPSCDLTPKYLVALFHIQQGQCYYTGDPLTWNNHGKRTAAPTSVSIDRLVPKHGYTQGNVVLCSFLANTSKGSRSESEFYDFCKKILEQRTVRTTGISNEAS